MSNFEEVLKELQKEHYKEINSLNNQLDRHMTNEIRLADKINKAIEYLTYLKTSKTKYNLNTGHLRKLIKILKDSDVDGRE